MFKGQLHTSEVNHIVLLGCGAVGSCVLQMLPCYFHTIHALTIIDRMPELTYMVDMLIRWCVTRLM